MTPLQKMLADSMGDFREWQCSILDEYERKAKSEIKAMGEVARRGLGQRFRWAAQRLKGA